MLLAENFVLKYQIHLRFSLTTNCYLFLQFQQLQFNNDVYIVIQSYSVRNVGLCIAISLTSWQMTYALCSFTLT